MSERPKRQTLQEWVVDLCWVKDCRDGFVSREVKGYSTLFGCPQCDRWKTNRPGYTQIPTLKRWMGRLELFTDEEMDRRRADRQDVVDRMRSGNRGTPEPVPSWTPADSNSAGAIPSVGDLAQV